VVTAKPIPKTSKIFIDFPRQFSMRKSSYECDITDGHNKALAPYGIAQCSVQNSLRRIVISGLVQDYAGDVANPVKLCYIVKNVENPASSGPTDNF
jgi:hypothetical protein